jgi:CheY-like chemotaxis protein
MPILVIDDSRDTLEAIAYWLRHCGYVVEPYDNARDAWQALCGGLRPALIILDLNMPGMNGFEFRAAQLCDERLASIPVVILSGTATTRQEEAELGAVRILIKPTDLDTLLAVVEAQGVPKSRGSRVMYRAAP